MALYEERDLQGRDRWQARVARERRDISQSVEETLADRASREELNDDVEERSSTNTSLVPPRLSLQSKVHPSVRSVTFVQSVTAELAAQKTSTDDKDQRQKPQPTGILARFAQHITTSIAAFGSALQPATPEFIPSSHPESSQIVERHPSLYSVAPVEVQKTPSVAVIDAIPSTSSISTTPPVRSKQRLAGHTSKIHLQTAHIPTATHRPQEQHVQDWSRTYHEPIREPLTVNVRLREKAAGESDALAALSSYEDALSSKNVQDDTAFSLGATCAVSFGSGAFESGQAELMVRNTQATATSVVHVTLTSQPGPTLVQYVSLHPEVGFTLHLTAPTAEKTTFNYMLLIATSASL